MGMEISNQTQLCFHKKIQNGIFSNVSIGRMIDDEYNVISEDSSSD